MRAARHEAALDRLRRTRRAAAGKPGLVLAFNSGTEKPAAARAAGAATVFFDLNFNNRVGTPTAPRDPATMIERADRAYRVRRLDHRLRHAVDRRERALRCADADAVDRDDSPVTAPTSSPTSAGSPSGVQRVFVTIANPPLHGRRGGAVGRDLAASAVLIRQVYFTSPNVAALHKRGPLLASRACGAACARSSAASRRSASRPTGSRSSCSSTRRSVRAAVRLQPSWKWFEIVGLRRSRRVR